jgi:hypothetical protein
MPGPAKSLQEKKILPKSKNRVMLRLATVRQQSGDIAFEPGFLHVRLSAPESGKGIPVPTEHEFARKVSQSLCE